MWKQEWVKGGFDMALHYMAFRIEHYMAYPSFSPL